MKRIKQRGKRIHLADAGRAALLCHKRAFHDPRNWTWKPENVTCRNCMGIYQARERRKCSKCGKPIRRQSTQCWVCCYSVPRGSTLMERFKARYKVNEASQCWEWSGSRSRFGYGSFNGSLAHRVAWELFHGPIPEGICVLHECDNPPCVNSSHLFLGTDADNAADKVQKGRHLFGQKHYMAKLNEDQVRAIRADARSAIAIARSNEFPVGYSSICLIRKGRTWRRTA